MTASNCLFLFLFLIGAGCLWTAAVFASVTLPTPLKHNLLHDNAARLFESFLKPAARQ